MIELAPHREGVVLPVRAQPGARDARLRGVVGGALKVSVTAAPEKGRANQALLAVLGKALRLRKSQIELISGAAAPHKRFLIRGLDAAQLRERIDRALREA